MIIELKKFGTTLVSRQAGKEAFNAFQPILRRVPDNEAIIVDFSGVITFSPSWGDEFLTQLREKFGDRLTLLPSENPSVEATLEILEKSTGQKFTIVAEN